MSGVRSSWLIRDKNSDLLRLASSADSFSARRIADASRKRAAACCRSTSVLLSVRIAATSNSITPADAMSRDFASSSDAVEMPTVTTSGRPGRCS